MRGRSVFLGGQERPRPKRTGPNVPRNGTFYMRAHSMRNNQILHGDQTTREEGRPRMLTHDLVAVDNLLILLFDCY